MSETQGIQKGDIFYTSWGYDQTNYNFLVIEEISKTGKTAKCRMARLALNEFDGEASMKQVPKAEGYGRIFQMKIEKRTDPDKYGFGQVWLRGSYPFCENDQTATRLDTFHKHEEGKVYYETAPGFGH